MSKGKILINRLYSNGWFNMFCISITAALGYTQVWPGIVFPMLYLVGFAIYDSNKLTIEQLMEDINKIKAQLNKK